MSAMSIETLVKEVKRVEKENGLKYPNLLGGRDIEKIYGGKLGLDNWTKFHDLYDNNEKL